MLWKVFDRQSPANTNWHRQTGHVNDFRFSLIRDKRLFYNRIGTWSFGIHARPCCGWKIYDAQSSRLVFFLRPLYSMSVNVPCFTSFTALICWLYYITFYRFVHGFDQSEVPFVIPFSSWQIITLLSFISNTFVSFFSVAFHQSPCFSCQFFLFCTGSSHGFPSLL